LPPPPKSARPRRISRLPAFRENPSRFPTTAADGSLAYDGAIDSIRPAKQADIAKATNYVTAALDALGAGRPVDKTTSQPYGCGVKY
jgi:hypothetical protein